MIVEKGYAKINLGLEVIRRREDNYHDLSMVMTSINLYDELYFEENKQGKHIVIDCPELKHITLEDNLVYKTIKVLKDKFQIDRGVRVRIVKRIPEQAGLGGGSADAAATLRAVNKLWHLGLSLDELAEIGATLGSDIPFCIYNKTAKVSGRGEVLEFIDDVPYCSLILAFPKFKSSTAEVFNNFVVHGNNKGKIVKLIESIKERDINLISDNLFNDLESFSKHQDINYFKNELLQAGCLGAVMTGSGSTIYGICLNDKDAKKIINKLNPTDKGVSIFITETRSSVRYKKINSPIVPRTVNVLKKVETKAYGMLNLVYQCNLESYLSIETPLSVWDNIIVEQIEEKTCDVLVSGNQQNNLLSTLVEKAIENLDFGLRVRIEQNVDPRLDLINADNYLGTIISSLQHFDVNVEQLLLKFPKKVKAYQEHLTFQYDERRDEYITLSDIPFGYVLIAPLNINNYQNPRYTKQIINKNNPIHYLIEGIDEKNFYKVAGNIYNSRANFEKRVIEEYRGRGYIRRLQEDCFYYGASGFVIHPNGQAIVCLLRHNKQAQRLEKFLSGKYKFKNILTVSLKSNVIHQMSISSVLKTETYRDDVKEEISFDYDYDDYTNPFDNTGIFDYDHKDEIAKHHSKYKKKGKFSLNNNRDFERILLLHEGGSLFKQFDFVDIANYFQKFFHNKYIEFIINEENYSVWFDTSNLPHILGLHLLDEDDPSLRGQKGFEKLMNGEISYRKLKKSGKIDDKILRKMLNKTQSAVLIFNDIFNGRLYNIGCYPREIIASSDTKMENLLFGVTRKLTDTTYHKQNLLGIGCEPNTNKYYFLTSYLWQVPSEVGKKDSYKISISR